MGTGQMLLTIGAIVILGGVILNVNSGINNTGTVLLHSNIGLDEISLAASAMEEAQGLAFDENTNANTVTTTSQLTPPGQLGQENGDSTDLDDFDDYNGLNNQGRTEIDTLPTGIYYVHTTVHYANTNDLTSNSDIATWNKRLDVRVWNTLNPDTIKMQTIFSYWPF
jgi:hypothetical protein